MKKVETIQNPQSCLNRAADDEPVFVLRANDPVAAMVVRYWASCYVSKKLEDSVMLTDVQHAKVQEARNVAAEMEKWRRDRALEQRRALERAEREGAKLAGHRDECALVMLPDATQCTCDQQRRVIGTPGDE